MKKYFHVLLAALVLVSIFSSCLPTTGGVIETNTESALTSTATDIPTPTSIPAQTSVPTPVPDAIYVDPNVKLFVISPYVYGSNYGPWVAVPADMLPDAYDSGVTILRFPGGEWGDQNDLKTYQVDYFMEFCQQMNAEVNFTVRLREGTSEQAAEWVRYVNKEKGYGVRYWTIGNEPTLYSGGLNRDYDTEEFNLTWRTFAEAMKAVDPSILLIGPEVHQYTANHSSNPKDSLGLDWMEEFLKANGDIVDIVSFHRYPFPKKMVGPNATIDDLHKDVYEWDDTILYLRELIHEITGRDIPIALTEFNSHYTKAVGGEGTPDSFYNAIWLADVLGRLIRHNVLLVNQWMLTSIGGQGGWGLVGRGELRPSYYVYQMYKKFGDEFVYASSDDRDVSVYAALRPDGDLTILIINLSAEQKTYPLVIEGEVGSVMEYWLFDETHLVKQVESDLLDQGVVFLPGASMSMIVISAP
jgi:hypothetical protein